MFQLFKSMDVKSFDHQFPHLAGQDTYRMSLADVDPEVDGVYDLVDYYCLDLDCDCRKVIIFVLDSRKQQMATIAYSWESISFYIALGADQEFAESLSRGILEPLAPQSKHAQHFLNAFLWMATDQGFTDRFKDRYRLFRDECTKKGQSHPQSNNVTKFPLNKCG